MNSLGWWSRLTLYCELVRLGSPIVIEEFLKVDRLASSGLLRQWQISTALLDLDAQLGCRRDISTYAQPSTSTRSEEERDIQVLG